MATSKFPMPVESAEPVQSPAAHLSRVYAMISAIEQLCIQLEDECAAAPNAFPLVTAIEACAEIARQHYEAADQSRAAFAARSAS